ncbi:hypothetical protein LL297_23150 [Vibrio parahaemolyticus]|nr:hypothetical protein [Vibrio parahaemolyticus]MCU8277825.1 hypothetical protein [Vibrio vulnificus]MCU8278173.1 hypothetical protein [Vibrio vulnificus]
MPCGGLVIACFTP